MIDDSHSNYSNCLCFLILHSILTLEIRISVKAIPTLLIFIVIYKAMSSPCIWDYKQLERKKESAFLLKKKECLTNENRR